MCHIFPRCSALVQVEEGAEGKWLTHVHLEKPIKWQLHHQDMLWKAVASINSPTKILHSTTDQQHRMRWTAGSTWLARNKPLPQQLATHNNNQIHDTHASSTTPCYIKTTNTFYRASACVRLSISVILTHTHLFNSPLSGTTGVSWYQKGKTNLDFTEARDSDWQWHQLDRMQVCTLLQTDN